MRDIFFGNKFNSDFEQNPITLVDVGASGGVEDNWVPASKHLNLVGFEPDKRAYEQLITTNDSQTIFNIALSDSEGSRNLYLTRKQELSSFLKPNIKFIEQFPESERYEITGSCNVKVTTLDNIYKENSLVLPDFMKIDTQGTELDVIRGTKNVLENSIFGLQVEVAFQKTYMNQPGIWDVCEELESSGFSLYDVQRFYWKLNGQLGLNTDNGQLIFGNALFISSISRATKLILDSNNAKSTALRFLSICLLYGYRDLSIRLISNVSEAFSIQEVSTIEKFLRNQDGLNVSKKGFWGKHFLYRNFSKITKKLKPHHNGWATSDDGLGNQS